MEKGAAVPIAPDVAAGTASGAAKMIGPVMPETEVQDLAQTEAAVEEPEMVTEKAEATAVKIEDAEAGEEQAAPTPPPAATPFPFSLQHPSGPAAGYAIGGSEFVLLCYGQGGKC